MLYQWKNLVPTIEIRLTPIKNVQLNQISAKQVKFISRILGEQKLPVKNVTLKQVNAAEISDRSHIHENIIAFKIQ